MAVNVETSGPIDQIGNQGTEISDLNVVGTFTVNGSPIGAGSVTSVDVDGGTTGLTFTGGPVTDSGVITMDGTLVEVNGGTNQDTYTTGDILYASGADTLSVLPIGSSTNVLTVTAGVPAWAAAPPSAVPGGDHGVPGDAGTDTVTFGTAASTGNTVTVNGVVFTFSTAVASGTYTVTGATSVTVGVGGSATATTTANDLNGAILQAKGDGSFGGNPQNALTSLSPTNLVATEVLITDSQRGIASSLNRTLSASTATAVQNVTGGSGTRASIQVNGPGSMFYGSDFKYLDCDASQIRLVGNTSNTIISINGNLVLNASGTSQERGTPSAIILDCTNIGFFSNPGVTQPVAIADATDAPTAISQLNLALAALRALGLIAT